MMSRRSDRPTVVEAVQTRVHHLKQPSYTGSNRCSACTLVNLVLVVFLAVVGSTVWLPLGAVIVVGGVLSVYLRGYLVPGTPALTKRYVPVWLLKWFGQPTESATAAAHSTEAPHSLTDEAEMDIELFLRREGAVTECDEFDDLRVTDSFAREWRRAMSEIRDGETSIEASLADIVDANPVDISLSYAEDTPRVFANVGDTFVGQWVSKEALVADVAAATLLRESETWTTTHARDRGRVLGSLRVYVPSCPTCDDAVEFYEDVTGGCCWSTPVVVLQCTHCEIPLIRLDQSVVAVNGDN